MAEGMRVVVSTVPLRIERFMMAAEAVVRLFRDHGNRADRKRQFALANGVTAQRRANSALLNDFDRCRQ